MLIEPIIELLGGERVTAKKVGVTQQAVSKWKLGKMPISPRAAIKIEQATGGLVTRAEIRPDIFGDAV